MQIKNKERLMVDVVILLVTLVISSVLLIKHNQSLNISENVREDNYFRPVEPEYDLIFGNPDADIFIVEYGDLECPFCQEFHPHAKAIIQSDWGISGKVAWVWRNGFHINETSVEKAITLECIRAFGGENARSKAWEFIEESLEGGVLEGEYPFERYREIIEGLDIPFDVIDSCKRNNRVSKKIKNDLIDIDNLDIEETPYLQFISKNGEFLGGAVGVLKRQELENFIASIVQNK